MKTFSALFCLAAVTMPAPAQDIRPDPTRTLSSVIITAERAATVLNRSTAAVTRLTAADLAAMPNASLADVMRSVPGFAVVNFDGLGRDPQLMARGFYGGGEADYVVVLVDGRPVNLVHNGTIAWETLPPVSDIASIEIVRGSASAIHGDAAVGGVVNIMTRRTATNGTNLRVAAESHSGISASADVSDTLWARLFHASAGYDRTDGFRDHSARSSGSAQASLRFSPMVRASLRAGWRDFEEPGPLLESLLQDGTESDPRFQLDGGHDTEWGASVDFDAWLGAGGTAHTTFRATGRSGRLVRTLPLTPDFGDTRERALESLDLGVTTQADLTPTILPFGERLSVGASLDLGAIDSRYFSADGSHTLDAQGEGSRIMLGVFAHMAGSPRDWFRWTVGARLDRLHDTYSSGADDDAAHLAFSPKAGVNVRYAPTGHAWASLSRTFKAPTLDQLFDQRPIPIPFPPFSLTTSNPDLEPQRGTSLETGLYHDVLLSTARLGLTLTAYQIAMKDELDFDVQSLKYVNIGQSRHRGLEAGLSLSASNVSGFLSMTLQDAVARAGANSGNRLKAIPGQMLSTGVTYSPPSVGTMSLSLTRTADMWIDDANTGRIPSWTRVDAQVSRPIGAFEVVLGARNLLDTRINTTGFLDPSGSGQAYWYPAAGRVISLGVRHGR